MMKKRLFSLLLIVAMLFALLPLAALAEEGTEEPEQKPAASESQGDDATKEGAEEGEPAGEKAPDEGEIQNQQTDPADPVDPAPEPVQVIFVCTPEDLTLTLYAKPEEEGEPEPIQPEADGSYMLLPGEYLYTAAAQGYAPAEDVPFTVAGSSDPLQIDVTLTVLPVGVSEDDPIEPAQDPEEPAAESTEAAPSQSDEEPLQTRGLMGAAPQTRNAYSGQCGDNAFWSLENGVLTISGTGAMWDYYYDTEPTPWDYSHTFDVTPPFQKVIVEEGITHIGDQAFACCSELGEIIIPSSVISMGHYALDECEKLTSAGPIGSNSCIQFGWTDEIPNYAFGSIFEGLSRLEWIILPASMTRIGRDAFENCGSLSQIFYGGSEVESQQINTQTGNDNLVNATWHYNSTGPAVEKVYSGIMREEDGYKLCWKVIYTEKADGTKTDPKLEIWLDGAATTYSGPLYIMDSTGEDMTPWLTQTGFEKTDFVKITLRGGEKNALSTQHHQFMGYSGVKTVSISHIDVLDTGVFQDCTALTLVEGLDSHLHSIAKSAFKNCTNLMTVSGSEYATNLTNIGAEAFMNTSLFGFTFCDSIKSIGDRAFYHAKLYEATLGTNVEEIGTEAFARNLALTIYCYKNSTAHNHAIENNIPFILFSEERTVLYNGYSVQFGPNELSISSIEGINNKNMSMLCAMLSDSAYPSHGVEVAKIYRQMFDGDYADIQIDHEGGSFASSCALGTITIDKVRTNVLVITIKGTQAENTGHLYNDVAEFLADMDWTTTNHFGEETFRAVLAFEETVANRVGSFIGEQPNVQDRPLKVIITGHSLGGAVANLLAMRFVRFANNDASWWSGLTKKEDIFAYTFGSIDPIYVPRGTYSFTSSAFPIRTGYENIHNVYNVLDTFGPFGDLSGTAAGNAAIGKYGHMDLFEKSYKNNWFDVMGNHMMSSYLKAVCGSYVGEKKNNFSSRIWIRCPVDVKIYDGNQLVGRIINNTVEEDVTSVDVTVAGDNKCIFVPYGKEYQIQLTATDKGDMEYSVETFEGNTYKYISYKKVALERGKQFVSEVGGDIAIPDVKLYVVNDDGEPVSEVHENGIETPIDPAAATVYFMAEGDPVSGTAEVDGVPYPVVNGTITLPVGVKASVITQYTYNKVSDDPHQVYPVGMKVWIVETVHGVAIARRIPEFDDILQYAGSSIRYTGKKGIRMITAISKDKRTKLIKKQLAGYSLLEYGTVVGWDSELEGEALVLNGKAARQAYAYKKGVADPIFRTKNDMVQYTNVLVGLTNEKCKPDLSMRPYMIVRNAAEDKFVIYGGTVHRSIGYIAYQNRDAFRHGTRAYKFIWDIVHYVYGTQYDAEYWK